jgi:hypothetical protein
MLDDRGADLEARAGRFEIVLPPDPPLDPLERPDDAADTVHRYREAGATKLNLRLRHRSLGHYLEQLEAMMKVAGEAGG